MCANKKSKKLCDNTKYQISTVNGPKGDHLIRYVVKAGKKLKNGNWSVTPTKLGLLIGAISTKGEILVGWSKRNRNDDAYSNEEATTIALKRALKGSENLPAISMIPKYIQFVENLKNLRTFKGKRLSEEHEKVYQGCRKIQKTPEVMKMLFDTRE